MNFKNLSKLLFKLGWVCFIFVVAFLFWTFFQDGLKLRNQNYIFISGLFAISTFVISLLFLRYCKNDNDSVPKWANLILKIIVLGLGLIILLLGIAIAFYQNEIGLLLKCILLGGAILFFFQKNKSKQR